MQCKVTGNSYKEAAEKDTQWSAMDPTTLGGSGTAVKCGVGRPWHWQATHCTSNPLDVRQCSFHCVPTLYPLYPLQTQPSVYPLQDNLLFVSSTTESSIPLCNNTVLPCCSVRAVEDKTAISIHWASASQVQVFIRSSQCILLSSALPLQDTSLYQMSMWWTFVQYRADIDSYTVTTKWSNVELIGTVTLAQ